MFLKISLDIKLVRRLNYDLSVQSINHMVKEEKKLITTVQPQFNMM